MYERFLLGLLALVYLLLSHIFIPNLGGVMLHPREYFIWIAINSIVFLAVLKVVNTKTLYLPPVRVSFLLFVLLSVSSILFNPLLNKSSFLIQSVHLFAIYFVWLALSQFRLSKRLRDDILLLVLLSATIEAVIGVFQFFGFFKFLPITPIEDTAFVWGAFQQKNLFGSFVAVGLVVSLYGASIVRLKLKRLFIPAFYLFVFFLSMSLVFSNSRAAWVGFLGGSILMLTLRSRNFSSAKAYLLSWFLVVVAGISMGTFLYGGSEEYRRALLERESSNAQRILMLKTSWEMFKERPITGHGFGNFESLYMYYQSKVAGKEPELKRFVGGFVSHPHNEIAYISVQSGLLGLLGLALVSLSFIRALVKLGRGKTGLYLGVMFPFLFHSLVEYPLELSVVHYFTFILFLSMATGHLSSRKVFELRYSKLVAGVSALVFVLLNLWFLITFKDYMSMVLYKMEEDKGRVRPELLEEAKDNLYLKNWAVPVYMFAKARKALEENDLEFLKEFVLWSEKERLRRPIKEIFAMEALALIRLGRRNKNLALLDESMKVVEEGMRIYPNWDEFKKIKALVFKEALHLVVDYQRGGRGERK